MSHKAFKIEYFDCIDSTNTELKRRALAGAPSLTVLVADEQTAGRGRMGRSFFSPRGSGLYMSILLRPVSLTDVGILTTMTAVSVARALSRLGLETGIKWVNDVIADGKKLCGILTEGGTYEGEPFAIIGIGINIKKTAFPEEITHIATSIEQISNTVPHKNDIINNILDEIYHLANLDETWQKEAMDEYRRRSVVLGKAIRVHPFHGDPFDAEAVAIEDDGTLTVRPLDPQNSSLLHLSSAEVSIRYN